MNNMKTKLKICFLCRTFLTYRGGTESYYFRMANALTSRGNEVHIITQHGKEKSYLNKLNKSVNVHQLDFNEDPFKSYRLIQKYIPITRLRYAKVVEKKIRALETIQPFDIIQFPDWSFDGICLLGHQGIPLIVRLHGTPNYGTFYPSKGIKPSIKTRFLWRMCKRMIFQADGIFANSNDFARLVKQSLHYDKPIKVIYNGIDQSIFKPSTISMREQSILFVGRLEWYKGINVVAKAIPLVLKDYPDIRFIFAGVPGKYNNTHKTWEDYLKENIPSKNLVFLGNVSQEKIVLLYQTSLISILPSLYEPQGIAALESMACGCTTIATMVGGFPESIRDGEDGILIPVNDPESLARAIKLLLRDDALRNKISINAINKITSNFNLNTLVEETVAYYQNEIILKKQSNLKQFFGKR